jgi:hypothetical protein
MPPSPVQIHLFRIYVRHYVNRLACSIDFPVTGMVVVPGNVTNIDAYIEERQTAIAQLRMVNVAMKAPGYSNIVASMTLSSERRKALGAQPRMPADKLFHTPVAADCEACLTIALCDRNVAAYTRLRRQLTRISDNARRSDDASCLALSLRLSTYAE